jgi:hypothetical protein
MSARRACVAASPPADDASAIDESNLNPTASSLASSSWQEVPTYRTTRR